MEKTATITCICNIEVRNANEYEALTEVDKMLGREHSLSDRTTLIVRETVTTSLDGCGVVYNKENTDGNV
jgi:hypothetical protein|tara:strand:- start:66 stop:275 length:210 start_codon:yes stop_codon:yes gene_type:complete